LVPSVFNMRLKDINHISPPIFGVPPMEGTPLPPAFKQGEDVFLEVHLRLDDKPITIDNWDLSAILKQNKYAECPLWTGILNNGIYEGKDGKTEGCYEIIIPSSVTSDLKMGTYWLDIKGHQKLGKSDGIRDFTMVFLTQPITIDYSPSSPNPGKALNSQTEEGTYPQTFDTRRA